MTSRERVLMALAHRQPDRTPRDFWAEESAWNRLLSHLGLPDREALLQMLEIDVRHLETRGPADREEAPGVFRNFWGERYLRQSTSWGPMREDLPGALATAASLSEIEAFPWPVADVLDHSLLPGQVRLHETRALVYGFADVWQRPALVRGWEQMFIDMVEHPEWCHFLSRKFTDFYREDYTRAAESTKGRVDFFLLISDLGSQRGPLISLRMFQEFVAPYLKEMIDLIHSLGSKVLYHSCGAIRPFIPALIELGVDVLDPIQPTGPDMSPARLKADFGGRLCFHGGIDMQNILPNATTSRTRSEARHYCETLGRDGGYILGPAHLFQPDVPPENILAVYDEAP